MSTATAAPPRPRSIPAGAPTWLMVGDASVIVFAVRYALGLRGSHGPEMVRQTIEANAGRLPDPARRAIVREVTAWLDGVGASSAPAERAVWIAALAALGFEA